MNSFLYRINFCHSFHVNLFRTVVSLLHLLSTPQFFISLLLNFLFVLVIFSLGHHRNLIQMHMYQITVLSLDYCFFRYTVGKITPVPLREVRSNDFGPRARIRMYFPCEGSQYTPPHCSVNFFWKDYCPMVFRYAPF